MTQNKFWLVHGLNIQRHHSKKEQAECEAKELAREHKSHFGVFELVSVFEGKITKTVNVIETYFKATLEESFALEPIPTETTKHDFKVNDRVLYKEEDESGVYWFEGIVIDIINDEYLKIQDKINQKIFTFSLGLPQVKPAE